MSVSMAWNDKLLELLNNLLLITINNIVIIERETLIDIQTCIQDSQEKIEFLQLEAQLQCEEIHQKNQHSKLILLHNNALFEFENDSHQQHVHNKINDATLEVNIHIIDATSKENEDDVCDTHVPLVLSKIMIKT